MVVTDMSRICTGLVGGCGCPDLRGGGLPHPAEEPGHRLDHPRAVPLDGADGHHGQLVAREYLGARMEIGVEIS